MSDFSKEEAYIKFFRWQLIILIAVLTLTNWFFHALTELPLTSPLSLLFIFLTLTAVFFYITVSSKRLEKTIRNYHQRTTKELSLLNSALLITSKLPSERIFSEIIEQAVKACEADAGDLSFLEEEEKQLRSVASLGVPKELKGLVYPKDVGIAGYVSETGKTLLLKDYSKFPKADPRFVKIGIKSVLAVPIYCHGKIYGMLAVGRFQEKSFTDEDAQTLEALARHIGIALENTLLYERIALEKREKEVIARKTLDDLEKERKFFAAELHDTILSEIVALCMKLEVLKKKMKNKNQFREELGKILNSARKVISTGRAFLSEISIPLLDDLGFSEAIKHLAESLKKIVKVVDIEVDDVPLRKGSLEAITLFRIIQEALRNVIKHSQAKNVVIRVKKRKGKIIFLIKDDGRGFNLREMRKKPVGGHVGLLMMQERASLMGGKLIISSRPHKGTIVKGWVPLQATSNS
jgi:signal transduction histidine kinase